MAISEFELKRCEKVMDAYMEKHRPPASVRYMVDLGYRIEKQSIVVFEIRPHWQNEQEKIETPVAKTTFVKSKKSWKVYWQRADFKWHSYEPMAEVKFLEDFLDALQEDKYACFFG